MLLAACDLIRAGAFMSEGRFEQAEAALDDAEYWDPTSAVVPSLHADIRQERKDAVGAPTYRAKAAANLDNFETYPELAALYYHISWRKGEPLRRNDLRNEVARAVLPPSTLTKTAAKAP